MSNGAQKSTPLTVSQKVVLWAQGRLGKKVGTGQCWDLAEEALKQAGAKTSNDLCTVEEDTDYIWGDRIEALKDVQRGDILQIRDHLVTTTTVTVTTFADGTVTTETKTRTAKRGHHTAIVRSTLDVNGMLKTYEQHVNGSDTVQKMRLQTQNIAATQTLSAGKHKHPKSKKLEPVQIRTTVAVEVSGKIWAYRPKAK